MTINEHSCPIDHRESGHKAGRPALRAVHVSLPPCWSVRLRKCFFSMFSRVQSTGPDIGCQNIQALKHDHKPQPDSVKILKLLESNMGLFGLESLDL